MQIKTLEVKSTKEAPLDYLLIVKRKQHYDPPHPRADYRGYGEGGVDFLKTNKSVDWIITNPPYGLATEFAIHSLECANNVALLLKIQFLEGASRHKFFMEHPPKSVNVFSKRLKIYKNGINTGASSMMCFAWFVWEKGFGGSPVINWIL